MPTTTEGASASEHPAAVEEVFLHNVAARTAVIVMRQIAKLAEKRPDLHPDDSEAIRAYAEALKAVTRVLEEGEGWILRWR